MASEFRESIRTCLVNLGKSMDMSNVFRESLRTCPVNLEKVYGHVRCIQWKREVWRGKIWFNPAFRWKCLYQVRAIAVFPVFWLLTDFVCLLIYEFCLSLCKIARCSVILLLPLIRESLWTCRFFKIKFWKEKRKKCYNIFFYDNIQLHSLTSEKNANFTIKKDKLKRYHFGSENQV